jgi:hypothetical protein
VMAAVRYGKLKGVVPPHVRNSRDTTSQTLTVHELCKNASFSADSG